MRERRDEVHGDAAAEGEADDAEGLGAPRERRGGSREEDLQGEQGAGVGDEGRVGVAAAPEVCLLVKKKRLVDEKTAVDVDSSSFYAVWRAVLSVLWFICEA